MAKKKPKFYVVWEGHSPGVYKTWKEAQAQIAGFSNARYKSFDSLNKAELAFLEDPNLHWGSGKGGKTKTTPTEKNARGVGQHGG